MIYEYFQIVISVLTCNKQTLYYRPDLIHTTPTFHLFIKTVQSNISRHHDQHISWRKLWIFLIFPAVLLIILPVSQAQAISSVSKPSAFHSWRGRGKAERNKRNELPAGATWKSPKPSASHLSG